jgi:hypothetical protein
MVATLLTDETPAARLTSVVAVVARQAGHMAASHETFRIGSSNLMTGERVVFRLKSVA